MRSGFKHFLTQYGKYLFIVAFGVLLYKLCEHLPAVGSFFCAFKKAAAPVFFGLAAAYVLFIPVSFFETRLFKRLYVRRRRAARAVSMLLTYIIALGTAALILILAAPRIASAAAALAESLDGLVSSAGKTADGMLKGLDKSGLVRSALGAAAEAAAQKIKELMPELLPRAAAFAASVMSALYSLLLALVISVYALLNKEKLLDQTKRLARALLPERANARFISACSRANGVFKSFITGQAASCLFVGALCYIGMRILELPYPELISAFICVAALIPVVGPWASTVPSALIILMSAGAARALWFILLILAIQLIDDNVIYPRVVGEAVGISGIWVLAAVLIGGGLFGLPGLFLAVPVTAVLYRVIGDRVNERCAAKRN